VIEPMSFISISGPKDEFDHMVNEVLSNYEIHLEDALTELKSASKLVSFPGTNPYREPYEKGKRLLAQYENLYSKKNPSAAQEPSMTIDEASAFLEKADQDIQEYGRKKEELNDKVKALHASYELVHLFDGLDFNIPAVLQFRHVKYRFGRILKALYPQLESFAETSDDTILCKCHETEHYISLLYFVPEVASDRIDAAFSSLQFEQIFFPDEYDGTPREEAERLQKELAENKALYESLKEEEHKCFQNCQAGLQTAMTVLESYYTNFNIRRYAALTNEKEHPFYILCGWMASGEAARLQEQLRSEPNTFLVIEDGKDHVTSTPPTKLKNPPLLRPFEMFVKMYGLPAYGEFDPTLLIAITYSIFFGFMFGDAGQGLLLCIGGFLLYKTKGINLAAIVSCCGLFSVIFGFLFGSVFGFEDIIPALWLKPAAAMTTLPFVGRLNTVFIVAIAVGMGVILLTMALNMIISFKNRDTEKTWFDTNGLAGFIFYFSLAAVIFLYMSGNSLPATVILVIMFLIPLLLIFLKEPLTAMVEKRSEKISGGLGMFFVEGFFELFEVLLSYFSNTLSFVRVGAFAVSHAAMMEVVLMLAGAETGNLNLLVVILGNLFVCGMEGLIVGIQVLRLEYYELFSRFYKGSGHEFKPSF